MHQFDTSTIVTARDGNGSRQMAGMEALLHSLMANAIKGDIRAVR